MKLVMVSSQYATLQPQISRVYLKKKKKTDMIGVSHSSIDLNFLMLKCYYDQIIDIHFFTFSCTI